MDWAKLPKELLDLISKCLESSFDLIQFRSVCSSWRSAAGPKRLLWAHNLPFFPSIDKPFLSNVILRVAHGSILLIKPHEPRCEADLFGWIVKVWDNIYVSRKMTLLKPMSFSRNYFPRNLPRILDMSKFRVRELCREVKLYHPDYNCDPGHPPLELELGKTVVKYLEDDKFVLLTILEYEKLAVFRSWDRAWTVINDYMPFRCQDLIMFDRRFFAIDYNGRTVVVDYSSFKLTLAADPLIGGGDKKFLIASCGEMFLVDIEFCRNRPNEDPEITGGFYSYFYETTVSYKFKFFKLVEREKRWVEVEDLGDKMFFLGDDSTFSASAADIIPLCVGTGSSVFFYTHEESLFVMDDRNLAVFDIRSGKIELVNKLPEYAKLFWPPPPWITTSHEVSSFQSLNHRVLKIILEKHHPNLEIHLYNPEF
ncbi:F-box family protein [Arabidopsis lyrata subsp. lyrata]|uniref:F-box family protein n=1 Tax=Arabidopsis lyrata subsp. lyrata TaxID=81972 RepID=D7L8Q7_ARALL|nr:F-box family protein [Arabidopsis lyrata subsp. lyrata]